MSLPNLTLLYTTPCTDEHEHHVDFNHICGVLEPLEYEGTEVLVTVLGVTTSAQAVVEF